MRKLVRRLADNKLSGAVTIRTESRRTVVLRFSEGRLVRVNARGNSVTVALEVLLESHKYNFTYSPINVDSEPELIPVSEFIERLGRDIEDTTDISLSSVISKKSSFSISDLNRDILHAALVRLVVSDIGPMASMIADQAIDEGNTIDEVIQLIADHIPDPDASDKFIELALAECGDILS